MYELLKRNSVITFQFDDDDLNELDCRSITSGLPSEIIQKKDVVGIFNALLSLRRVIGAVVLHQQIYTKVYSDPDYDHLAANAKVVLVHMGNVSSAIKNIAIKNLTKEYPNIEFKIEDDIKEFSI